MSALERKRKERELAKLSEADRLARLLSRTIKIDLYKATDAELVRIMARAGIDEPQDMISRLIHGADRLNDETLAALTTI